MSLAWGTPHGLPAIAYPRGRVGRLLGALHPPAQKRCFIGTCYRNPWNVSTTLPIDNSWASCLMPNSSCREVLYLQREEQ